MRIAAFVAKKDATVRERAERMAAQQADRNAKRDNAIALLEAKLRQAQAETDLRLNTQATEARLAEDRREEERAEARRKEQRAIEASRMQQLAIRKAERQRNLTEEAEMVAALAERNAQQLAAEVAAEAERAAARRKLAQTHLAHAARLEAKVQASKLQALEEDLQMLLALEEDDAQFADYVEQRTQEWATAGRDVKPILLARKKMAKATLQSG